MADDRALVNRQWRVARYPAPGELVGPGHFTWGEQPVPPPGRDEFLVRTICLAPNPAQRGYLVENRADFLSGVPVGEVMRGRGIGQVVASSHPDYPVGAIFVGSLGWQDYSLQRPRGKEFVFSTKRLDNPVRPLSMELGMLGQAGVTAWFGLVETAGIKAGDTVLVSSAAGGVGCMAGQIARQLGAGRVVGITSTDDKCRWLCDTLGFDAAINYRSEDVTARLRELLPGGIDVYFDNAGGAILDAALVNLAMHARIAVCGFISTNYTAGPATGPVNYKHLLYRRARMQGFVVFDYWERFPEGEQVLRDWYRDGLLHDCEDIDDGLEHMPRSLASLFTGANRGIKLCRVAPDPESSPAVTPEHG